MEDRRWCHPLSSYPLSSVSPPHHEWRVSRSLVPHECGDVPRLELQDVPERLALTLVWFGRLHTLDHLLDDPLARQAGLARPVGMQEAGIWLQPGQQQRLAHL